MPLISCVLLNNSPPYVFQQGQGIPLRRPIGLPMPGVQSTPYDTQLNKTSSGLFAQSFGDDARTRIDRSVTL